MKPRLSFLGGAGTVTGSCCLVEHAGGRLLVDCGSFQGTKSLKALNYQDFPFDPAEIGAVLLSHAGIDHSGLLPKLVQNGYGGCIHATEPMRDLLSFVLPNAARIQELEVGQLNRRRCRRGLDPVRPIYGEAAADDALERISPVPVDAWFEPMAGIEARYWTEGRNPGSASIELRIGSGGGAVHLLFSGDVGAEADAGPRGLQGLDYLVVESTRGDRLREPVTAAERRERLAAEVLEALGRGGNLVIPAFASERSRELLFDLGLLNREGRFGDSPIFLDSPQARRASEVFGRQAGEPDENAAARFMFDGPNIRFVATADESRRLDTIAAGSIILAAGGMCDSGPIRHHLMANLWRAESTILMVGHQAPGTLGRLLVGGARAVRILGQEVRVRARIRDIDLYSPHADQAALLAWITGCQPVANGILLTHGEPAATAALAARLAAEPGLLRPPILRPSLGSVLTLDRAVPAILDRGTARIPDPQLAEADWHNAQSGFLLELAEILRRAPGDQARMRLLSRLRADLNAQ
jgi:metallo-beta-lactamase family protein